MAFLSSNESGTANRLSHPGRSPSFVASRGAAARRVPALLPACFLLPPPPPPLPSPLPPLPFAPPRDPPPPLLEAPPRPPRPTRLARWWVTWNPGRGGEYGRGRRRTRGRSAAERPSPSTRLSPSRVRACWPPLRSSRLSRSTAASARSRSGATWSAVDARFVDLFQPSFGSSGDAERAGRSPDRDRARSIWSCVARVPRTPPRGWAASRERERDLERDLERERERSPRPRSSRPRSSRRPLCVRGGCA